MNEVESMPEDYLVAFTQWVGHMVLFNNKKK